LGGFLRQFPSVNREMAVQALEESRQLGITEEHLKLLTKELI
jgi:hypothetical protein